MLQVYVQNYRSSGGRPLLFVVGFLVNSDLYLHLMGSYFVEGPFKLYAHMLQFVSIMGSPDTKYSIFSIDDDELIQKITM